MILHSPLQPHLRLFLESPLSFILSSCESIRLGTLLSSLLALYVSFETQHQQDLALFSLQFQAGLCWTHCLTAFVVVQVIGYAARAVNANETVPGSFHYPDASHPLIARAIRSIHLHDPGASHSSLGRRTTFYSQNEMDDKDIRDWRCALFRCPVHRYALSG